MHSSQPALGSLQEDVGREEGQAGPQGVRGLTRTQDMQTPNQGHWLTRAGNWCRPRWGPARSCSRGMSCRIWGKTRSRQLRTPCKRPCCQSPSLHRWRSMDERATHCAGSMSQHRQPCDLACMPLSLLLARRQLTLGIPAAVQEGRLGDALQALARLVAASAVLVRAG